MLKILVKISPSLSIVSTSPGGGEGGACHILRCYQHRTTHFGKDWLGRRGWMYGGDGAFPWGRKEKKKKRLTVTHVSISLNYLIMKGGNFFTKSIAKIMNNYQNCNDLHQKYS